MSARKALISSGLQPVCPRIAVLQRMAIALRTIGTVKNSPVPKWWARTSEVLNSARSSAVQSRSFIDPTPVLEP
ncbi:hypothetical protein D3C87_1878520 [compost metagenome]